MPVPITLTVKPLIIRVLLATEMLPTEPFTDAWSTAILSRVSAIIFEALQIEPTFTISTVTLTSTFTGTTSG